MMARRWRYAVAVLVLLAMAAPGEGQRRELRKIEPPQSPDNEIVEELVPPTAAACEAAARRIAAAYGSDDLRALLHERFPNRDEVLAALSRSDLHVSRLELGVESLGKVDLEPWRRAGEEAATSDCRIDLGTVLSFDDLGTGERRALAGRHRWRIRFTRALPSSPGGGSW
jgi:hypothetical protein